MKKIIIGAFGLLVFVVIVVGVYVWRTAVGTVPKYTAELTVKEISRPVEIIRDHSGVPHIFAENDEDAYFALGYAMSQDRLFQLSMMRRLAQGRMSEIMGESMINTDKLFRTLLRAFDLDIMMQHSRPEVMAAVNAFLKGINTDIEQRRDHLPLEFRVLGFKPEPFKMKDLMLGHPLFTSIMLSPFKYELQKQLLIDKLGLEMANDFVIDYGTNNPVTISEEDAAEFLKTLPPQLTQSVKKDPHAAYPTNLKATAPNELMDYISGVMTSIENLGFRQVDSACNSAVISGELTQSGKPILLNDFHFPLVLPSYLYEAHMKTPNINTNGYYFASVPFVYAGQNDHVAWAFTAGFWDEVDMYIEKLDPSDPNRYLFKGQTEDMTVFNETIRVKGADDVNFVVRKTRHGVIIDDLLEKYPLKQKKQTALAMKIGGTLPEAYEAHNSMYDLGRARSADEFVKVIRGYHGSGVHWIYADDQGEIGYIYGGSLPLRKGFDGSLPVPGWNGEYEWEGLIPGEMIPQVRNPKAGYIGTANAKIISDDYPFPQGDNFVAGHRLRRIQELLAQLKHSGQKITLADIDLIFKDDVALLARDWRPHILAALKEQPLSQIEQKAQKELADWDLISSADSSAAALFQMMLVTISQQVLGQHLEKKLSQQFLSDIILMQKGMDNLIMHRPHSKWFDDPKTAGVETRKDILVAAFRRSVSELNNRLGDAPADWRLDDIFVLEAKHSFTKTIPQLAPILNSKPIKVAGGPVTLKHVKYSLAKPFKSTAGSLARLAIDLSDRKNSKIINMPGISENFMSPHYTDQMIPWSKFEMRPLMATREQAEQDKAYHTKLFPKN